jgi:superfamily II DNA or RNA helicase
MNRTERQAISIDIWRRGKNSTLPAGNGTIQACTGFGKTRVATNIAKQMYKKNSKIEIIVIVPTIALLQQWEGILEGLGLAKNTKVYVINTVIMIPEVITCDLLILDEIHKYAADTFFSLFDIIGYQFILGLTATLERLDDKHRLLEKYCPIVDDITLYEARKNGWVADYIEYNLYVEMTEKDKEEYDAINIWLGKAFAIFGHDYYVALGCCAAKNRFFNGKMSYGAEHFVNTYMKNNGEALVLYDNEDRQLFGQSLINEVIKQANNTTRLIREREAYLTNHPTKIQTSVDIIKHLGMKTVTFGKSTECADKMTDILTEEGIKAASYHSYLQTELRAEVHNKEYKTEKSAEKFAFANDSTPVKKGGVWTVEYTKVKKYGKDRLKKEVIEALENDEISVINSAKALDMGLDVTGMQLAIIISGDSNPTTQTQRIGRVIRKEGEKVAIIVNVLLKGTQDEKWCKRRQSKNRGLVRHITNIDDIMI